MLRAAEVSLYFFEIRIMGFKDKTGLFQPFDADVVILKENTALA